MPCSSSAAVLLQSQPHRIKMAHNLIVNYGLDSKMEILVSMAAFHAPCSHTRVD